MTSLLHISVEEIANMHKARWIKQNLNVPVLFSTTENAVFNQLFAALIAYVLLHWLYKHTKSPISKPNLSSVAFQRMLLTGALSLPWWDQMVLFLYHYFDHDGRSLSKVG
ncbi:hypothetical protein [Bacillus sp. REN10]|uniref:hypothetical protein n=1 Tax=Bacillus sp. REN10 TaxID=2782541 RepID=UPI00193BB189|nr:hypothetical protein [Bacillus sp. REN10]